MAASKPMNKKVLSAGVMLVVVLAVAILGFLISKYNNEGVIKSTENTSSAQPFSPAELAKNTLTGWKQDPQYQNPRTDISYTDLFHNVDQYKGTFVHYTGEVVQVLGESGDWNLRVNVTKTGTAPYTYWQDTIFVFS